MPRVLMVEPVFAARVWGGNSLVNWYGEKVPSDTVVGESWAISGLPGRAGAISLGAPAGYTLADAWAAGLVTGEPRTDDFPLLCKILDTNDWLSVQVHPNDDQAAELEGDPRGKSECWLVLEARPGAELVIGHGAPSVSALASHMADGTMFSQLIRREVAPGSFFMVPAGCVHAVGPGLLIYEVQQSSDITYRLYDFNRLGLDGQPRELHIAKSLSVIEVPYDPTKSLTASAPELSDWGSRQLLVSNEHFEVVRYALDSWLPLSSPRYQLATVISGSGTLHEGSHEYPVTQGSSFVVPAGLPDVGVDGHLSVIVTKPGPDCP